MINDYRREADRRGLVWELTREQFLELTGRDCHYCGGPPSNRRQVITDSGAFVYSGIDRVDPAKGYEICNVVAACFICNRAKNLMSLDEFTAWVLRVASRLVA